MLGKFFWRLTIKSQAKSKKFFEYLLTRRAAKNKAQRKYREPRFSIVAFCEVNLPNLYFRFDDGGKISANVGSELNRRISIVHMR